MMKEMKEKGITLVALIITIIILIILAAVTIKLAFGSNFIGMTINSTEKYSQKQIEEWNEMNATASKIENAVEGINSVNEIMQISVITTRNSATVNVKAKYEVEEIIYSIKEEGATEDIERTASTKELTHTFSNLDKEKIYQISVNAIIDGETVEKTIEISTMYIKEAIDSLDRNVRDSFDGTGIVPVFPYGTRTAGTFIQWELHNPTILTSLNFSHSAGCTVYQLGAEYIELEYVIMGSEDGINFEAITENKKFKAYNTSYPVQIEEVKIDIDKPFKFYRIQFLSGGWNNEYLAVQNRVSFCIAEINIEGRS